MHTDPQPETGGDDDTSQPGPGQLELRVMSSLDELTAAAWNGLGGERRNPFLSWQFLEGLERTGCVAPERGWVPCHLTAWRGEDLVAAAPAYVKGDEMGDFSRDWGFGHALQQLGGSLYPKLVIGVPFSPVSGQRFLHARDLPLEHAVAALCALAQEVCRQNGLARFQVLYCSPAEAEILTRLGLAPRALIQYHWHNRGYATSDDWLAGLKSKRRTQARRERREPELQGVRIRTVRGAELAERADHWAGIAHGLYRTTCDKYMWGGAYLNRAFFDHLFTALPENVELVVAERAGEPPIAGAINVSSDTHLYGRYWGCHEELRFLHFNVCLYHSIDDCIARGLQVFEGGAGGEHKISRGFEPEIVHGAHWFSDRRVHALLRDALRRDEVAQIARVEAWKTENRS